MDKGSQQQMTWSWTGFRCGLAPAVDWLWLRTGSGCGLALAVDWLWLWTGSGCGLAPAVYWLWLRSCAGSMQSAIKAKLSGKHCCQKRKKAA